MKLRLGQLRSIIKEVSAAASPEYMKKEALREELQRFVVEKIISKSINNQQQLDSLFQTIEMIVSTLKMIPFDIWQKIIETKK